MRLPVRILGGRCRCGEPAAQQLAWGCAQGHTRQAGLCAGHAALTRAAIASGLVACGRCRKSGRESTVGMLGIDGTAVSRPWN